MSYILLLVNFFALLVGFHLFTVGTQLQEFGSSQILEIFFFLLLSLPLIGLIFVQASKSHQDIGNPLGILVISACFRIALPSLILVIFGVPETLAWMNISRHQWLLGFILAVLSILGITCGWLITPKSFVNRFSKSAIWLSNLFVNSKDNFYSALVLLIVGFFLMLVYYKTTTSSNDLGYVFQSGGLRSTSERVAGTSRFSYLGLAFLYFAITYVCSYLFIYTSQKSFICFFLILSVSFFLFPNGGRIIALNPIVFGLSVFWYTRVKRREFSFKKLIIFSLGCLAFLIFSLFAVTYRAGLGVNQAALFIDLFNINEYFSGVFLSADVSILQVYALASFHHPGIMNGSTYPLLLGGIFNAIFGLDSIRPGVFLIENLVSFNSRIWGIHTGIFVDLYLNTGLVMAIVGCILLGAFLRGLYEGFFNYFNIPIVITLYTFLFWNCFWVFYESIIVFVDDIYRIMICLVMQYLISRNLPKLNH